MRKHRWGDTPASERGYDWQWTKTRNAIMLRDSYLCQPCLSNGRPTPADAVDHITPKAEGGTDDHENLQAICDECHKRKTAAEAMRARGCRPKPTFGADGWPEE